MSKFVLEMESVAVPKRVKDDLDAPLETSVHSQFRGGVGQLQWLQLQRKSTPVVCHWNLAEQVGNSQRS